MVQAFQAAIDELLAYVGENEDDFRAAVSEFQDMPEDVAGSVTLDLWTPTVDREQLNRLTELVVEYDVVEEATDIDAVVATGAE